MLRVEDAMTREVATLSPDATAAEARKILNEKNIRHLLIVEGERLVGLVSDRDLRDESPPEAGEEDRAAALEKVRLADIMTEELVTVGPQDIVEYAARLMSEKKIDCLPVVEGGSGEALVGIVTTTDMMLTLVDFLGAQKEFGSWVEISLPDRRPAVLHELSGVLKDKQVNVVSFFTSSQWKPENRNIAFRLETVNPTTVVKALEEAGYEVGATLVATPENPAPTEFEG